MDREAHRVTRLLASLERGTEDARDELFLAVYDELRRLAHDKMRGEAPGRTLQTTGLVHEAYLRLVATDARSWENRAHFFGTAAEAMRRILIESARKRRALKRGGGRQRVSLRDADQARSSGLDVIELDRALVRLEEQDARKAQVVKLRYYVGLDIDETADVLGVSPRTVDGDWRLARAWLRKELPLSTPGGEET